MKKIILSLVIAVSALTTIAQTTFCPPPPLLMRDYTNYWDFDLDTYQWHYMPTGRVETLYQWSAYSCPKVTWWVQFTTNPAPESFWDWYVHPLTGTSRNTNEATGYTHWVLLPKSGLRQVRYIAFTQ